jgi:hypothetical protein
MSVSLLQYVLTSVFALEQALPQGGMGVTKKQIVMNGVTTILKATSIETAALAAAGSNPGTNNVIASISSAASDFVDATVKAMNAATQKK